MRSSDWSSDVCSSDLLSPPADAGGGWRQLLQEGRWQGIVQRRSPAGAYVGAAVRQHVRYHDDGTPRDIVEYGQGVSDDKRPGYPDDQVNDARLAAPCEIDLSSARDARAPFGIGSTSCRERGCKSV